MPQEGPRRQSEVSAVVFKVQEKYGTERYWPTTASTVITGWLFGPSNTKLKTLITRIWYLHTYTYNLVSNFRPPALPALMLKRKQFGGARLGAHREDEASRSISHNRPSW